jgi:hypothetical protein
MDAVLDGFAFRAVGDLLQCCMRRLPILGLRRTQYGLLDALLGRAVRLKRSASDGRVMG